MNRRGMLKASTVAGLGAVGGFAFTAPACNKKDLSGWIVVIIADYGEIKPLLPQLGLSQAVIDRVTGWIDTAVSVAKKFDDAYQRGDFATASTLFLNLGKLITDIATELSATDNRIVELLLVGVQIARITIASLLKVQGDNQPQMAARRSLSRSEGDAVAEINRLASIDVGKVLKAIQ